jgi:hypothetical protein
MLHAGSLIMTSDAHGPDTYDLASLPAIPTYLAPAQVDELIAFSWRSKRAPQAHAGGQEQIPPPLMARAH